MHLMDIYKQFHSAETNQLNKRSRRSAEESDHLLLTDDMRRIIVEESDNIITITAKGEPFEHSRDKNTFVYAILMIDDRWTTLR